MKNPIPVLVLFGPTASGKTGLLERLFTGPQSICPAEIISADSMQIYRGMDIGTAKPSPELRAALPHHLIDIRSPREPFNAGEFVRLADEAVARIAGRGALPVVSGGTGFYLSNFIQGLSDAPPSDAGIRKALGEELAQKGPKALMAELAALDPVSAAIIHLHDHYRLLRALEVYRISDRPLSSFSTNRSQAARSGYRFLLLALDRPREEVYSRVDRRCADMFRQGLEEEVRRLYGEGFGPGDPGMRAIGYREFFIEEEGRWTFLADMAGVEALVTQNSRRYAKRQITWFASIPGVIRIAAGDGDPVLQIRQELAAFLEKP
ncbi:MAG: tRNA (adenosine(37)-N6)-dimethylallyltransferase MiaA [Treponema sp.]|jgi:tRNA dimethylallyltransferase|nr:tRNA (adenosine(37)-N6)-dimethylallyltransferase MiaA [Treponema sp.]